MAKHHAVSLIAGSIPWAAFLALVLAIVAMPYGTIDAFNPGDAIRAVVNGDTTRLLRSPTVSATQIAFAYANNIWMVERAGGMARRLTSFQGQTTNPHFSPDGKWIAFSGEYAGNIDVYVVPAEGGEPKRLTWHPGRRHRAGLDARRQVDRLRLGPRDVGAERRAALLDGAGRGRRRSSRCRCRAAIRARFRPTARTSPTA